MLINSANLGLHQQGTAAWEWSARSRHAGATVERRPLVNGQKRLLLALGVLLIPVTSATFWVMQRRGVSPMQQLIEASPREERILEARLSGGFPWAPLVKSSRMALPTLQLRAVAGRLLEETDGTEGHASALAHLFLDHTETAVRILSAVTSNNRNPAIWNDLGAAHLQAAVATGSADHLTRALAAFDQALRFDPSFAESLFNRALVVERHHLRDVSIAAWRKFLSSATADAWKEEAQQRLDGLLAAPPPFASEIERQYPRLQAGDLAAARSLLEIDAGDARYFGETEGLARWGEAWLRKDLPLADQHLAAIRTLSRGLSAFNGERLLQDAVAVIERATPAQHDTLARGHVGFRDGRAVYKLRRLAEAEAMLVKAKRDLEQGGTPLSREVEFFVAVADFDQGRYATSETAFRRLATVVPAHHAALHGYLDWLLASCAMTRVETGETLMLLLRAIETFTRLRESNHAAFLHDITSQIYDGAGDSQRAAAHRVHALRGLGQTSNQRLAHALSGMVNDAFRRKEWRVARSFLDIQVEIDEQVRDPEIRTETLLRRSLLHAHLGESASAQADLRSATAVVSGVTDPALRLKLQMDRDAGEALISDDPGTAVPLLTEVLRFHRERGWRRLMPDLHLRRGRMYAKTGDRRRAVADYEAGIVILENHRQTIPIGEQRWGVLDAGEELFDEAIAEALSSDPSNAFAYAERKRARSLSDSLPEGERAFDPRSLPQDAVLVEYAALASRLVVFVCSFAGCEAREVAASPESLSDLSRRFAGALQKSREREREKLGAQLSAWLIAPVQPELAGRREVVFVPDAATAGIPFAALRGGSGRMLIEDFVVSVSPSARVHQSARRRTGRTRTSVLVVENPTNETMATLEATSREASAVEAIYPRARRLTGRNATAEALREEVPGADVIHFAGHGVTSSESSALVLAPSGESSGRFDTAAISRLQLPETEVVVLAACDTARGPVRAAEGTLSVAHAFLQAGAPSVIATLWPIDDREAAEFFPLVHRHLAGGASAAEALRLAQLEWMRRPSANPSALWAAIQAIGY